MARWLQVTCGLSAVVGRSGDAGGSAPGVTTTPDFLAVPVTELELTDATPAPTPNKHGQIWLLVRRDGVPVGSIVRLEPGPLVAGDLRPLADELFGHGRAGAVNLGDRPTPEAGGGPEPVAAAVRVTVVLCTLGRDERLRTAVTSVLDQRGVDLELLVLDNDPSSGRVPARLADIRDPRLRVVEEPRRGLSFARNRGLVQCRGSVVAFTDDDACADPEWLVNLLRPLGQDRRVVCTTGLVLPAEISTQAQVWFEAFGGFDKGFERLVWSARDDAGLAALGTTGTRGILFPYAAGAYGSGNNMAFDVSWLRSRGGFDVTLGAGMPPRGGEDLDAFLRVILDGKVIVYEPRALVRHHARAGTADLHDQMYGYGSGMSAVIVKNLLGRPRAALSLLGRFPAGVRFLLDPGSAKNADRGSSYPRSLSRSELKGYLAGPFLYVWSRARVRFSRG